MASLKNIKLKILSYKKTGTVTHAMEAVSAVKMRKSQERALGGRAYAAAALSVLERLSGTADLARYPLMSERAGKIAVIVITSDKGLAGSLNSNVIRRAQTLVSGFQNNNVVVYAFGRRGGDYFATRGYTMGLNKTNVSDNVSESEVQEVTKDIIARADVTSAHVVYQNFISTFEQSPTVHQILPIKPEMMRKIVEGIRPARGKYAPQQSEKETKPAAYTIEPDADSVLAELLPRLLNIAIFHALLESKASEHSARMVAMKSATDKAKEKAKDFTRVFNKVRQAAITREVSEITSGIEAMK